MALEDKIDTHAHFIPPFYRRACEDTGHGKPDGMPAIPVPKPSKMDFLILIYQIAMERTSAS
jgi:hypothetical protein